MDVIAEKIYLAGHSGLLGKSMSKLLSAERFSLETRSSSDLDLRNSDCTYDYLSDLRPDGVIFCAAHVGGIGENSENPLEMFYQNSLIQYSVLNAAYRLRIPRLVFVSSAAVFPANNSLNHEVDIWDGVPSKEHVQYAVAKISGMEFVKWVRERHSLDWVSVIPTNIYGENDRWDQSRSHVIAALIMKIVNAKTKELPSVEVWGTGNSKREFLHADDVASAILKAYCGVKKAKFDRFNLGSGTEISVKELASLISELCGYSGHLIFNPGMPEGPKSRRLDMNRTNNFIDWKPETEIREGIMKSIAAYRVTTES